MRRRTLGPLPLLDGLQLSAAEGSPHGLLRALNVEARDGFMQTRRGAEHIATVFQAGNVVGDVFGWTTTEGYVGLTSILEPDMEMIVIIDSSGLADEVVDGTVTVEFAGTDGAWHACSVLPQRRREGLFWKASQQYNFFYMVVPSGWANGNDDGNLPSLRYWLRFTAPTAWSQVPVDASRRTSTFAFGTVARVLAPSTRTGQGPFIIAARTINTAPVTGYWEIFDLAKATDPTELGFLFGAVQSILMPAQTSDNIQALYIPDSDVVFIAAGPHYVEYDPKLAHPSVTALFAVEVAEQYEDIACESALPERPSAMCLFGGRIFIGGPRDEPTRLQWSAPGGFWRTWPSANIARVGGAGGVVALIPVDETLYIFTTSSIWRAVLADPTAGNESDLFIDLLEETPCSSALSPVAVKDGVVFLSNDGVRILTPRGTRLISDGVRDLFRSDSEHALACMRRETAIGLWHPVENQYRMSYASPGGMHNDAMLVVDLDDRTAWLWGADPHSDPSADSPAPAQRARGVRLQAMAWDNAAKEVVAVTPEGCVFHMDSGADDLGDKTVWYAESQTLRVASGEKAILEAVDISVQREHFQSFRVQAIPDGDRARADSKDVSVQRDGLDAAATIDEALENQAALQLDASIAPVRARFRKSGRNHRVRVESISPDHHPIKALALTVDVMVDDKRR